MTYENMLLAIILIIGLIAFAEYRIRKKRKFKTDKVKKGDIVTNQSSGQKSTITGVERGKLHIVSEKSGKGTIKLPGKFSPKEMAFIENWYSEKGMQHLLKSNGNECEILPDEPPPGCKYVMVEKVPIWTVVSRNPETLQPVQGIKFEDIKLILLNEWIN